MAKGAVKETLVDTICDNIKRDIIAHVLKPGEKIKVKELSERYGASETPIKLALNRLIAEQIIDNYPRQGMRVHALDADEAREIFDIRLMLDLHYAKQVIETVSFNKVFREELSKNVEEHLEVIERIANGGTVEDYIANYNYDYKFHELYLKCSGNKKALDVYRSINPFTYSNYVYRKQSKEKDLAGVEEHKKIIQAIFDQDEERLKECLRTHSENAVKSITFLLKMEKML